MKKVATLFLLGVTILSTVILGGCGKTDPTVSKEKTPYAVVENLSANGQNDVKNYLTEQSPDITKIKQTVEGYIKSYTNVDYKTTDGMGTYGYVNDEMLQEFKNKNDAAESVKFYKDNALVAQFNDLKIDTIKVTKDMNLAEIKGSFTCKFVEGSDAFFKQNNFQKGALLQSTFTMQVEKQNDVWKVSYRKVDAATPVNK